MEKPTTIEATNRDIGAALRALETLAKERGFPDHVTVLRVGMTIRQLRNANEEMGEIQQILINSHAKRDDDGRILRGADAQSVQLEDPQEFLEESTALLKKTREVEIWPIPFSKLGGDRKKTTCPRCKQVTGMPEAEPYATLVALGILVEKEQADGAE